MLYFVQVDLFLVYGVWEQSNNNVLVLCLFIGKQEDLCWRWTKEIHNHRRMWYRHSEMSSELLNMVNYEFFWYFGCDDPTHTMLWSNDSDRCDNLVVIFRGSLEIHSVIEGEHAALLSCFDHYEASLMDEDHLWYNQSCVAEIVGTTISKQREWYSYSHPKDVRVI